MRKGIKDQNLKIQITEMCTNQNNAVFNSILTFKVVEY